MIDPNQKRQINFSIEEYYIEKIRKHAERDARTMSNFIRSIIVKELAAGKILCR